MHAIAGTSSPAPNLVIGGNRTGVDGGYTAAMSKAYSPIFYCLALVLTAIAAMPAGAQPNPFGGGGFDDPVTISGQVSQPRVAAGGELLIAVILDHQPGWHVWPAAGQAENDPSADVVIIPTEIRLPSDLPAGVTLGEIRWPTAYDALAAGGIIIKAYKGTAIAHIPVTIAEDAAPGDVEVKIEVYYQACDDQVCIIPTTEPANVSFTIVDPDALGDLSEPDPSIFSEAARVGEPGDHDEIETPSTTEAPAAAGHGDKKQSGFAFKAGLWGVFALVIVSMLWMVVRTFAISKKPLWRGLTSIIALVVIGGMVWYAAYLNRGGGDEDMLARFHEVWAPYSPEAFEAAQAEGKIPVLDFTADWCINCKVLEQTVLATRTALDAVSDPKFAPMQADITTNDAPGHAKLEELGPGGIPRLAVYHPHLDEPIQYKSFYTLDSYLAALEGKEPSDLDTAGDVIDFFGYRFNVRSAAPIIIIALIAGLLLNFTPACFP
jgi:DsbC/DsbD-like thiol-disulfide interchange protein